MNRFYTIGYRLIATSKNGNEELIDVQTLQKAFKTRENAYKALMDYKEYYLLSQDYKPSTSEFSVVKDVYDYEYEMQLEINEHWTSDYEEV